MKNFKFKMIFTILGSIIFSFTIIILALALPTVEKKTAKTIKNGKMWGKLTNIKR
jgi:hypothetical protein